MNFQEFRESLSKDSPPKELSLALAGLWWDAKGEWEVLSVNPLGDEVFATPAIADGRIYLRTKSTLYAFAR